MSTASIPELDSVATRASMNAGSPITPSTFRQVLGNFCSGVVIVASAHRGELSGLTCQSFFSVSLDPPLVAFCPSAASISYPRIRRAGGFCVNILSKGQEELCRRFAKSGGDKWRDVQWMESPSGNPILDGVLAWIDCTLETELIAGDHSIVVGRVHALQAHERRPLLFFRGSHTI